MKLNKIKDVFVADLVLILVVVLYLVGLIMYLNTEEHSGAMTIIEQDRLSTEDSTIADSGKVKPSEPEAPNADSAK